MKDKNNKNSEYRVPSTEYGSKRSNPSSRPLKVGEMLRHKLSEIFLRGETHDPLIDGASITVSEVRVSPDLRNATVYVMPLAGANKEQIMRTLDDIAPRIRHLLASHVELRYMPKLYFKLDRSFEEAHRINELLTKPPVS